MPNPPKSEDDKKQATTEKSQSSVPSISLPKGGGAIRGMGEKFAANPVTGTGSMTVPIATSPGRSGFGPQLSLSYDSGAGNGPFGFGWNLSLPSITRKTDKSLPQYWDTEESDVFILSGAEDLVPVLVEQNGKWVPETLPDRAIGIDTYTIRRYRPRIEGLFARIERWTRQSDGDVHWRSITKDNITTFYGKTPESRIADPSRVFSWLICESYDDKGNAIIYEYKRENADKVDRSLPQEKSRLANSDFAQLYLKRIKYGNSSPFQRDDWLFEVVFDYGEHDAATPTPNDAQPWPVRLDPFSSYRAGFEVRTYRLCRRVLMFHRFSELGNTPCLVRSTDFNYTQSPIASFISTVTHSGYVRNAGGTYLKKSLPPLEFTYTQAQIDETVHTVDAGSIENLPYGLDGARYQWMDLDNEGISGILTEQAEAWFYKRNLSPISFEVTNGRQTQVARFAPIELVATKPSLADLNGGQQQFMDLAGDGQVDLVQFAGATPGYYERTDEGEWETFVPFASHPQVAWNDPNLKFVDLTGDGHADILITEDEALTWHPSLAEEGFGPSIKVRQSHDEEKGPKLIFADGTQSIYLADLSGDGLTDLVRIRNGEVCYWPNLGYGRFGAKVTMDGSPWFDSPDLFDQRRIRLADIDGSGVTDIIYLGRDAIHLYFNQSGNSWSKDRPLNYFPRTDNLSSVTVVDLLGNGTACLVWSSPLPNDARRPMRYIDLMGGQKPHLLISNKNNLGAETKVTYASSAKFYLQDKREGQPWITKLPFPVHVVERVETYDYLSRNFFVTRYRYHHGYFDGVEREFRGFGMVEQFDTEEFNSLKQNAEATLGESTNVEASSHMPPVRTKTWFHTGAYLKGGKISKQFEAEYYRESDRSEGITGLTDAQLQALLLEDTVLADDLTAEEMREACRALKGSILRQEIYALDGTVEEDRPYSVSERNYAIKLLQSRALNKHAVFFAHPRETIDFHYERKLVDLAGQKLADPRVSHQMTLQVNEYGNVERAVAIGYPRRALPERRPEQKETHLTLTVNRFANQAGQADWYRIGLPVETQTYEMVEPLQPTVTAATVELLKLEAIRTLIESLFPLDQNEPKAAKVLPYAQWDWRKNIGAPIGTKLRLIERVRTIYYQNDLAGALPLGQVASLALPYESYKLAFTPGLIAQVYAGKVDDAMLSGDGKYLHSEGNADWWIPSGRQIFDPTKFYLPVKFIDPFIASLNLAYEITYDVYALLMIETKDPLKNVVKAENDYRVLQPKLVTDPNENRAAVAFDALGMITGTAVLGKATENKGDSVASFKTDLLQSEIDAFFADPKGLLAATLLGNATSRIIYEVNRFVSTGQPAFAATLARETHVSDPLPVGGLKIQVGFSYSDGFGREIQKKIQAEPGLVNGVQTDPRWVGSGWTIFNNKGKPVKQYEPFFSKTHDFEFGKQVGVSSTLFYDPVERVVATLHPNHTYEKVIFDPWRQETWDVNDTVLLDPAADEEVKGFFLRLPKPDYFPSWHEVRKNNQMGAKEKTAADKTAAHANTPTIAHFDTLGRPFLTIADNATEGKYETRVVLDIEGNQREVIDAKDRVVMGYDYDMLGNKIHQDSMDAGKRWMLNDVAGKPIRSWDSRGHEFIYRYDELRRPTEMHVKGGDGQTPLDNMYERIVYGENKSLNGKTDTELNLRSKPFEHYDTGGKVQFEKYDFKGNLLNSNRRLAIDYKNIPHWGIANPDGQFENNTYPAVTEYDALNRVTKSNTPDGSETSPTYNAANLLETVEVLLPDGSSNHFVTNINYNEKGQRTEIFYGNNIKTTYEYERETFRLIHLETRRANGKLLQDLRYAYDPVGNITQIEDRARPTIFFNNFEATPVNQFNYDAIYRLIEAQGREHIAQVGYDAMDNWNDLPFMKQYSINDPLAWRTYTQFYQYDEVGNIRQMKHTAPGGNWTRDYTYEVGNNRLKSTTVGDPLAHAYTYTHHPQHGFMTGMPHLQVMEWNFKDELQAVAQQRITNGGTPEITYYVYDFNGQRIRKVTENSAKLGVKPTLKSERIYTGGIEVYKEYSDTHPGLERKTLHVMDDKNRIAMVEVRNNIDDGSPVKLMRYQFSNHLGTACLEMDGLGRVISYEEYHPYGTTSYQAVDKGVKAAAKHYRYTGKERDEENGFYYHGARYYAPWLGRWVSCDKEINISLLGLYVFVKNNPLKFTDPTGNVDVPVAQTYANGKNGVGIDSDGAITVQKNDWLSKYSAALHGGDATQVSEYERKVNGEFVPVDDPNKLNIGETIYHRPTRLAYETYETDEAKREIDAIKETKSETDPIIQSYGKLTGDDIKVHWRTGKGKTLKLDSTMWQEYMMAHVKLREQAFAALIKTDAPMRTGSASVGAKFHGEVGGTHGGYFTGYELLHGSKGVATRGPWKGDDQGDVQITGTAKVKPLGPKTFLITYELNTTWNDIEDPNPKYFGDTILGIVYKGDDYKLKVSWQSKASVLIENGRFVRGRGWPYVP